ncbi:MAG: hypothetical protein L6R19_29025 [Alphaproteobacteria bacterium]|nr:hypothetical protein [Alphaproteobacteria bacterium]
MTKKAMECAIPSACVIAAGFGIWFAAMAAMAALPTNEGPAARVQEPTGVVVLYQDPKTLETVPLRAAREVHAL